LVTQSKSTAYLPQNFIDHGHGMFSPGSCYTISHRQNRKHLDTKTLMDDLPLPSKRTGRIYLPHHKTVTTVLIPNP